MPHLLWTTAALRDIDELDSFLRLKSRGAADRAFSAIHLATQKLIQYPLSGRAMPELGAGIRHLPVHFSSSGYLLRYRIVGDTIRIVQVKHMRQRRLP